MAPQDASSSGLMVSGFLHLMASQVSSRVLTFVVNLLIARRLTPEAYGVTSIQFHLIMTTILFLSREGFRRGCMRSDASQWKMDGVARTQLRNTAWLVLPLGLAVAGGVFSVVVLWQGLDRGSVYAHAVGVLSAACFVELCSEPLYIMAQNSLAFRLRAVIDTTATFVRCIATYGLLAFGGVDSAVASAYSQLLFSFWVLGGYILHGLVAADGGIPARARSLLPSRPGPGAPWLDWRLLRITGSFAVQAVEKHVLAEGGKMVMALVATRYNQGVYGLVSNLGSLVVRCVLHPFEESAFTAFSKAGAAGDPEVRRGNARLLQMLLKAVSLLGLTVAVFGPPFSYSLLRILYSDGWSETEAPRVLSMYCVFVFLMAVNGVTEAFVHAVVNPQELTRANMWLVLFAAAHMACVAVFTTTLGSVGLVVANCVNMLIRITYSGFFIRRYCRGVTSFRMAGAAPSRPVLVIFLAAAAALHLSSVVIMDAARFWSTAPVHMGVGVACLAGVGVVGYKFEKSLGEELAGVMRGKGD